MDLVLVIGVLQAFPYRRFAKSVATAIAADFNRSLPLQPAVRKCFANSVLATAVTTGRLLTMPWQPRLQPGVR